MSQQNKPSNGKNILRKKAMERVAEKEPFKSTTSVKEITKIDGNATSYSMNGI